MRLKQVEVPMVVHSNLSHNIHGNGLDKQYSRVVDKGGQELPSHKIMHSETWDQDYNNSNTLASNDIYKQNVENVSVSELRFQPPPSPVHSLPDDEEGSQTDSWQEDGEECPSGASQSSDTDSEPPSVPAGRARGVCRGIVNPNYPGFQHFASQLHSPSDESDFEDKDSTQVDTSNTNNNNKNNNNNCLESLNQLNQLDSVGFQKPFYDKPKFDLQSDDPELRNINEKLDTVTQLVHELNIPVNVADKELSLMEDLKENNKMADAFLSGVNEEIKKCEDTNSQKILKEEDSNKVVEKMVCEEMEVPRKKEKLELNLRKDKSQPANLAAQQPPANMSRPSTVSSRRASRDKKKLSPEILGGFDVYNIETAMPTIDLDAIENHLKAAREEERRRRNDREEIRKRLATGCDGDEYYGGDRPGRKPSLQARLQSGMNLQICFMNDTMSDTESPSSDSEATAKVATPVKQPSPLAALPEPNTTPATNGNLKSPKPVGPQTEADFFAEQARLQAEARLALAQAKDLAHLQMEMERQRRQISPITEMLRTTLLKVGVVFPEDRRRVSRQMLTDMNVAQLQVIVNDLHTQIEFLNESLVKLLMERDDLHMTQDSMLVDIEDLTRYLGAKENTLKEDISLNNNLPPTKAKQTRIAGLVRK